jgi:hypothetical protein
MKVAISTAAAMAAAVALNIVAFAQATQSGATTSSSAAAQQDQQVTITGCVQRESDYRRAQGAGAGGVVGTGVGAGNEYILAEATMGSSASTAVGTAGNVGAASASSTAKAAYELTGANEGQVGQYVGQRVEIMGKLKPTETGAAGPTGGPTAGAPPAGIDVTSKDLKLRELEVTSVRTTTGTCAAK